MPQSAQGNDPLLNLNVNNSLGGASEFEALFNMLLGKAQTITLVKVVKVDATGVGPVGKVSVQPLVHQLDGAGNIYPLGVIHNVPYFRLQGGANAVICDPAVGDIGLCGFASRDISIVKRNKTASAPGSRRQYAWSDGLYIGGVLNGTPSQYVRFHSGGIEILSPGEISLVGSNVSITSTGDVSIIASGAVDSTSQTFAASSTTAAEFTGGGGINADGDVKANNISLKTHTHSGVTTGGGNTGGPL